MIIFDLDTLADCEHRLHFVDPSKKNDYTFGFNPKKNFIEPFEWYHK